MDVGNLPQLERTFECRRECVAATEEAEVLRLCIFCRDFLIASFCLSNESICFGSPSIDLRISEARPAESIRIRPRWTPSNVITVSVEMNALVDATPISGPACM